MGARGRARGSGARVRLRRADPPAPEKLTRALSRFPGTGVLVWGDFVLDEYWRCRSGRVSREAPVLVLEYQSRSAQGGGAANAALNLAAMGARVCVAGWVGADAAGHELRRMLEEAGVDTDGLLEHDAAPTVVKTRVVAGDAHTARQQVVRIDRGAVFPAGAASRAALLGAVRRLGEGVRAVVLSDYGYDSVSPILSRALVRGWRRRGVVVGVDARYRLHEYRGVSLATPNEGEAAHASGHAIDGERDLERAAERLRRRIRAEHLIVTRGRDGLTLWNDAEAVSLEAWGGHEAVDVTGAGDAVVAAATLALARGAGARVAAALANVAGSVAVSRRGAVAVTLAELRRALGGGAPRRAR